MHMQLQISFLWDISLYAVYILWVWGLEQWRGGGGALLCNIVISNMKLLDFLDLS